MSLLVNRSNVSASTSRQTLFTPDSSSFMDALVAPYSLISSESPERVTSSSISLDRFADMSRHPNPPSSHPPQETPPLFDLRLLTEPVYRASGKWEWLNGVTVRNSQTRMLISTGESYTISIRTGNAGDRTINYISKLCTSYGHWDGFLAELALYKVQLKPLQGDVVPTIIGVYCNSGRVSLAMTPPHDSFWMEASPEMPKYLKRRCVEAVAKLHKSGVCHGDLKPSNILIGGDAKVHIINFDKSRALISNKSMGLAPATAAELRMEMRKIKWQLDYECARVEEDAKYSQHIGRSSRNQGELPKAAAGQPKYLPHFENTMEDEELDPAIEPDVRLFEWSSPREYTPRRFVMPGQTAEVLAEEVRRFIELLDRFKDEEHGSGSPSYSFPIHPPDRRESPPATPVVATPIGTTVEQPNREVLQGAMFCIKDVSCIEDESHLTVPQNVRKRKSSLDQGSNDRPVKRLRFAGVSDRANILVAGRQDDENRPQSMGVSSLALPSSSVVPDFIYDPPQSDTRREIIEANIQRCAELGLPHPEAIERYPKNQHWRNPDVMEYIQQYNRSVLHVAQLKRRYPEKRFKMPQLKRSEGNLKRAMNGIGRYSGSMVPTLTTNNEDDISLGKRKWDSSADDIIGMNKCRKFSDGTDGRLHFSSTRQKNAVIRGILKNSSSAPPRVGFGGRAHRLPRWLRMVSNTLLLPKARTTLAPRSLESAVVQDLKTQGYRTLTPMLIPPYVNIMRWISSLFRLLLS